MKKQETALRHVLPTVERWMPSSPKRGDARGLGVVGPQPMFVPFFAALMELKTA